MSFFLLLQLLIACLIFSLNRYGICKIIPPASWNPRFEPSFRRPDGVVCDEFHTKMQRIQGRALEGERGVGFKVCSFLSFVFTSLFYPFAATVESTLP